MTHVNITPLMQASGIDIQGTVEIGQNMSGVESEPKDDWLYLGLRMIHTIASEQGERIRSAAGIGSGNGIIEIAMLRELRHLRTLVITDILPDILGAIRENIKQNFDEDERSVEIAYIAGADCEPIPDTVDLIYGNLPLIMVDEDALGNDLATTTLTDAKRYLQLSTGPDDLLLRWSLLSQLGFLLSAKEKLNEGGRIITLIGGRVPYEAICELFVRAGLQFRERICAFKRQSDPQFIKEYAEYEKRAGVEFFFYNYLRAAALIQEKFGFLVPDILPLRGDEMKRHIADARLTAAEAYGYALAGKPVGHLAFAFEAYRS